MPHSPTSLLGQCPIPGTEASRACQFSLAPSGAHLRPRSPGFKEPGCENTQLARWPRVAFPKPCHLRTGGHSPSRRAEHCGGCWGREWVMLISSPQHLGLLATVS